MSNNFKIFFNYATTAVFEETLQCSDNSSDVIQLIESVYPEIFSVLFHKMEN